MVGLRLSIQTCLFGLGNWKRLRCSGKLGSGTGDFRVCGQAGGHLRDRPLVFH